MIYKNTIFHDVEYVTVVEFGKGTVVVGGAIAKDGSQASVLLKSSTKINLPIGSELGVNSSTKEFDPEVVLYFESPESIDVLQETLNKCRKALILKKS